jgi:hypothetical protein
MIAGEARAWHGAGEDRRPPAGFRLMAEVGRTIIDAA